MSSQQHIPTHFGTISIQYCFASASASSNTIALVVVTITSTATIYSHLFTLFICYNLRLDAIFLWAAIIIIIIIIIIVSQTFGTRIGLQGRK